MGKILNIIIMTWLILLTVFVIYYVSYDRKMQAIDLKLDNAMINTHEDLYDKISIDRQNIEMIIEGHNQLINYVSYFSNETLS